VAYGGGEGGILGVRRWEMEMEWNGEGGKVWSLLSDTQYLSERRHICPVVR
jgi:hypothetical protein